MLQSKLSRLYDSGCFAQTGQSWILLVSCGRQLWLNSQKHPWAANSQELFFGMSAATQAALACFWYCEHVLQTCNAWHVLCQFGMKRSLGIKISIYSTVRSVQGLCRLHLASAASDSYHTRPAHKTDCHTFCRKYRASDG